MFLEAGREPYRFEASHWYQPESSSRVEDRLKVSDGEEAESVLRSSSPFLFSTSVGGGAPSERQAKVTASPFITSSPGLTERDVVLGGSGSETERISRTRTRPVWVSAVRFYENRRSQWTCRGTLVLLDLHTPPLSVSSSTLQVRTCWTSSTRYLRTEERFCNELEELKRSTIRVVLPDSQRTLIWSAENTPTTSQRSSASRPSRTGPGSSRTGSDGNAAEKNSS